MTRPIGLERKPVFGFDFIADKGYQTLLDSIKAKDYLKDPNALPLLITPNLGQLVFLSRANARELYNCLKRSYYVLPDGQPIITFSKLLGKPLGVRLTGSDLFPLLWKQVKAMQEKVLFILPSEEVEIRMRKDYADFKAYVPPFFTLQSPDKFKTVVDECQSLINSYQPDYVMIGLGFPKQEWLTLDLIKKLEPGNKPLFMVLGASFEFYTKTKIRAPKLLQRFGMEWLFRLMCEPRRLFARYFFGSFRFLVVLVREITGKPFNHSERNLHC